MRIERHVFGSYSGYSTLARSPGLTADDVRQLEASSYGFGQTSDRGYLKGLKRTPAWFTRLLRGGRRGLTRILEGSPDDNGRPTLLMITAVMTQREWDAELCGDVGLLLDDTSIWGYDGNANLPTIEKIYPVPTRGPARKSVPKLLALLSELERRQSSRQPIVVSAGDFSPEEMRALETLVPPAVRASFTCSCRSLSANLPVTVNCVAEESETQAANFRPETVTALSPYAQFLQTTTLAAGGLPLPEVMEYRAFGRREAAGASGELIAASVVPPPVRTGVPPGIAGGGRRNSPVLVVLLLLLSVLTGFAGLVLGRVLAVKSNSQAGGTAVVRTLVEPNGGTTTPPVPDPAGSAVPSAAVTLPTPTTLPATVPAKAATTSPSASVFRDGGPPSNDHSSVVGPDTEPKDATDSPGVQLEVVRRERDEARKHKKEAERALEAMAAKKEQLEHDLANQQTSQAKQAEDLRRLREARLTLVLDASDHLLADAHGTDQLIKDADLLKQYSDSATEDLTHLTNASSEFANRAGALKEASTLAVSMRAIRGMDKDIGNKKVQFSRAKPEDQRALFDDIEKMTQELSAAVKGLPEKAACLNEGVYARFKGDYRSNAQTHQEWVDAIRKKLGGNSQLGARQG